MRRNRYVGIFMATVAVVFLSGCNEPELTNADLGRVIYGLPPHAGAVIHPTPPVPAAKPAVAPPAAPQTPAKSAAPAAKPEAEKAPTQKPVSPSPHKGKTLPAADSPKR